MENGETKSSSYKKVIKAHAAWKIYIMEVLKKINKYIPFLDFVMFVLSAF